MLEPHLPQIGDLSELISKARNGFTPESRTQWYPRLPKIVLDGPEVLDMTYPDLLLTCEKKFKNDVNAYELERKIRGVPVDLRSKLIRGKLDRPGVEKVYDVITILSFRYRISAEDVYLVEPLVFHMAAAVRRIDACFSACSDMIRKSYWYITATMLEHRVKIFSFQDLVEVVMPATYRCLMIIKALTDEFLNNIFVGLFFSLLPQEQAYRILDSFLLEGGKILYRYGIALISLFKVKIKAGKYRSGEQFWADVTASCNSASFDFEELHSLAFDKKSKSFFKMLSRKRKINRRNISELKNQIRDPLEKSMALTKNSSGTLKLSTDICILAAVSTWFDRGLWSQSSILDTTMAIKLQLYLAEAMQPQLQSLHRDKDRDRDGDRCDSLSPVAVVPRGVGAVSSVQNMRLVFSSAKHGRSLSTLYEMVAGRSPCVLLLRSLHKQAVVGVYVSCSIAPCHKAGASSQRGDHSCFCFRLNSVTIATGTGSSVSLNTVSFFKSAYARQHPPKTPSVDLGESDEDRDREGKEEKSIEAKSEDAGLLGGKEPPPGSVKGRDRDKDRDRGDKDKDRRSTAGSFNSLATSPAEPYTMDSYVEHVKSNYISGDASVLMFGATASRQPLNAIRLDRELRMCYTAPSETFGNPNLVPEECSPFPVDMVEVYAGNFLDADVDLSLINEKGSAVSTRSSSAYLSVAPLPPPCPTRYEEACRDREEATVQVHESYTYGAYRKDRSKDSQGPVRKSSAKLRQGREKEVEKERERESECSLLDSDIDRPWEDEGGPDPREVEEGDPEAHRKYLTLSPANLGCMPPGDEDLPQRPAGAAVAMPNTVKISRGQYWEDGDEGKEKIGRSYKERERAYNEDQALEGEPPYVRQSTTSILFPDSSRRASGPLGVSAAEGSLEQAAQDPIPCSSKARKSPEAVAPDINITLNYESAGYQQKSVFQGTNSMVTDPHLPGKHDLCFIDSPQRSISPKLPSPGC